MKSASVALSVLGTIAVAGYIMATEFPVWERWTKKDKSQGQPRAVKSTKSRSAKSRSAKPRPDAGSGTSATGPTKTEPPVPVFRTGSAVYWLDQICDCQLGSNMLLETVELTEDSTILTILNAKQAPIRAWPPGAENAQFLNEWRYVNNVRPRLDLKELRGIGTYPNSTSPLHFQLVFPRISDEVKKIQLSGKATLDLDYFMYSTILLENEMTREAADHYNAYRRCGFDGVTRIPQGRDKVFRAHTNTNRSGFEWTTSSELAVQGSARKETAVIRGTSAGQGQVCLKANVGGESCTYCEDVDISSAAPEPDFTMKHCGGMPSNEPHWQFAITKPESGARYTWEISQGHILKETKNKNTLIMRTALRPSKFTVTLHTDKGGNTSSYSREYHTVYSCLDPF